MPSAPATAEALHLTGHCYCGGIRYAVDIPAGAAPIFTAYCHCDSCRRAHAAPLYHVVCVDDGMFSITEGAELLSEFQRNEGGLVRAFCAICGSKVLNLFPGWRPGGRKPVAFFPNTLDAVIQADLPEALRPRKQNHPGECVLDFGALGPLFEAAQAGA